MTPVETLRALMAKATPGPWLCPDNPESVVDIWRQGGVLPDVPEWEHSNAITPEIRGRDAELIVAMHAALPALLDVFDAAEVLTLLSEENGDVVNGFRTRECIQKIRAVVTKLGSK